jgi:hypothetical protein
MTASTVHPSPGAPADSTSATVDVSYEVFRRGLPDGRFHVIVNPALAQKYVKHRLLVIGIALPLLGIGAALALSGYLLAGLPLVAAGFLLPRVIKAHAPKILLHLAQHDAKTYNEAIDFEILEVRSR